MMLYSFKTIADLSAHAKPATLDIMDNEILNSMTVRLKYKDNIVDVAIHYEDLENMSPDTLVSYIKFLITGAKTKLLNM